MNEENLLQERLQLFYDSARMKIGGFHYKIDDEREVLNINDQVYMSAEEYPELARNPRGKSNGW